MNNIKLNNIKRIKRFFLLLAISFFFIFPSDNLHAVDIVATSYAISGNALSDDVITLHLVLENISWSTIRDVIFIYRCANDKFFPAHGHSNQFSFSRILPREKVEVDLKISTMNILPGETMHLYFNYMFPAVINDMWDVKAGNFLIATTFKSIDALKILGMKVMDVETRQNNLKHVAFQASVLNQDKFLAQDIVMLLEGINFDFSASIPLGDIGSGDYLIKDFSLDLIHDDILEFIVHFVYQDIEGLSYKSSPQRMNTYLNYIYSFDTAQDTKILMLFIIRIVFLCLLLISLILFAVFLFHKLNRKKGV